jgi:hypothetical protein
LVTIPFSTALKITGNASLAENVAPQVKFNGAGKLGFNQNTINLDLNRKFNLSSGGDINFALVQRLELKNSPLKKEKKVLYQWWKNCNCCNHPSTLARMALHLLQVQA